jgi:integrase
MWLLMTGLIGRNAAALAKPPRVDKPVLPVFTKDEAMDFLAAVKGHRLEAMFTVALALAMRKGEILGLSWENVDLEAGVLRAVSALQRTKRPGEEKSKLVALTKDRPRLPHNCPSPGSDLGPPGPPSPAAAGA